MKRSIIFIILTLFVFGNSFCQNTAKFKLYSPIELAADIDTLADYIEATHINPFYKLSKIEFYKELNAIKTNITNPISSVDFYFLLSTLLSKIEDGHTCISFSQREYLKSNPIIFPYNIKLSNNDPYIKVIKPYKSVKSELPFGVEILSVNNVESKKIIQDIKNLNSGESADFRLDRALDFSFYLTAFYKMQNDFEIKYKENNIIKTKIIKGIKNDSLYQLQKNDKTVEPIENTVDYSLKIIAELKTAIINFVEFREVDKFKIFVDSAFKQIKTNNIENLIIDLRENTGGNSVIGDELFQYIYNKPFSQFSKAKIKYSKLRKKFYSELFVQMKDSFLLHNINKPFGLVEDDIDTAIVQPRENPYRFKGSIYLLTSTTTFSSATDFAQCFKYYKMGKIIGQETGGWIVCYGDIINGKLPNTRLLISISHKSFYCIGAKENDWHGVIPDIEIQSDKAMDYTLKLINKN
ncbi:hypothetical protein A2326_00005 [candidate division WWE3 bacterium RIFOXYB2_FULL_41_6]|nr:MAG: hypothetical protein A2326_00005 [candidate division WWE3 bacterium RIFOXYB2_FULL_41_6]